MKTFEKTISLSEKPQITKDLFPENTFFFDIETTGFSPKRTSLYMIGYAVQDKGNANIIQLLADDPSEEELLLRTFLDNISGLSRMITFNGSGFDLPYLKEKLNTFSLPDPFDRLKELDIFKRIRPYKVLLKLSDCKQKTVEDFLSLSREDTYNGGDLIPVYRHYSATHDDLPLSLLLRHNFEDVTGMIDLLPVLSYPRFFDGGFFVDSIETGTDTVTVRLHPEYTFPIPIEGETSGMNLTLMENSAVLHLPVFTGELKYFFPDPENYYYLPEEDTALHKSVAGFVDKAHRKNATKATCYIRKNGRFLPQPSDMFQPSFRIHYKDKQSFFELPDALSFESDAIKEYLQLFLRI